MSESDVALILLRLDDLAKKLSVIDEKVSETNGRVGDLELENARKQGVAEGRRIHGMILGTVISGGILSAIIWFVSTAI